MKKIILICLGISMLNMPQLYAAEGAFEDIDIGLKSTRKIVFIGDSLTEYYKNIHANDNTTDKYTDKKSDSYVYYIISQLKKHHASSGFFRDLGYVPMDFSSKKMLHFKNWKLFKSSSRMKSMWRDKKSKFGKLPYSLSPDGKGYFTNDGNGTDFLGMDFLDNHGKNFTKMRVYYLKQPGGGTFNVHFKYTPQKNWIKINTNSGDASPSLGYIDVVPKLASDKNIRMTQITGKVAIYGVLGTNSNVGGFSYDIFARSGKTTHDFLRLSRAATIKYFSDLKPNIAIINLGTNDMFIDDTNVTTYKSMLKAYVNRIKKGSPNTQIVLLEPVNPKYYHTTGNLAEEYTQARKELCGLYGWGYVDIPGHIGNFNTLYNMGAMANAVHPNAKGKELIANTLMDYLLKGN